MSTSSVTWPTWWLLPTLPQGYLECLEQLAHPTGSPTLSPQDSSEELQALFNRTEQTVKKLLDVEASPWIWDVSLIFEEWQTHEQNALSHYALPPMKYQVHIETHLDTTEVWSCLLTPAELRVITIINPDLGRRIGDELDGRRPSDH